MATYDEEVKKPCDNCKQLFPESKIQLHEAYCLRNIRKCPNCDMFVDKRELEEHKEEFHTKVTCEKCGQSVENQTLMQKHIDTQCQLRPRLCLYCNVKIPAQEFDQHQYTCGSRTKVCGLCQKNILVRDYEDHMDTCVGIVEKVEKVENKKVEIKPKNTYPTGPNQSSSSSQANAQPNKGSNSNIPSSYPQNSINQILKGEREKEQQKKYEAEQANAAAAALKKREEEQKYLAQQQRNNQIPTKEVAVNKPISSYPSQNSQQQLQQQQRAPVSQMPAINNLDKNKIPNESKPTTQIPYSFGNKQPSSASNQPVSTNLTRPTQAEERNLIDKYGQKPPSQQGQRQPLAGNKNMNQEIPSQNKPGQVPGYQQQPISSYQMKQDDIYGGKGLLNNKADKDIYGQKKEEPKVNNNIYNARVNSKPTMTDAERQRKEEERLREQNELPTQGYYDNLKTIKNPAQFDYRVPDSSIPSQQKSTSNQPASYQPRSNAPTNQYNAPSNSQQYPYSNKPPSSQYPYTSSSSTTASQQAQYQQNPTSLGGQSVQPKLKPGVSNPTVQNIPQSTSAQSKNIQPSIPNSKQAPTKSSYDTNQGVTKNNPPTGYSNHGEILRNVPSQGISGIPNYQPMTKPGMVPSTGPSSSSSQNQRVPSRGKIDSKQSYPSSSSSQSKPFSNNRLDDDEDELQKAILKSLNQDQSRNPISQNQPSQQARQSSSKTTSAQTKPPNSYPQQNRPTSAVNNDEEEELQKAIMESMKGQGSHSRQAPGGKPAVSKPQPQQQQFNQYGNFEEDLDEEMARAIMQSYKQK